MNYKQKLIKNYFTTHYRHFISQTAEEWNWVINRIELNFRDIFSSLSKDSLILDVGCGVGYLEYYLLKNGFTRIEAIDFSEEQIQVAKKKLEEYGLQYIDRVKFETADAFNYLRTARGYELIVMIDFIDHLPKDEVIDLLQLSFQALNKGGILVIRTTNANNPMFARFFYRDFTHETPFTPDSLRQCLSAVGFEISKIDYEVIPTIHKSKLELLPPLKRTIRRIGLWSLGKFLGVPPEVFTEDLIAIGEKQ